MSSTHYSRIILHVPHSGTQVPESFVRHLLTMPSEHVDGVFEIMTFSRPLIDYYTDELFVPKEPSSRICSLVFPYNRVLCDVERLPHDPLETKGYGILYNFSSSHQYLRECCQVTSLKVYMEHYLALQRLITDEYDDTQNLLLMDCHSFSARPNALCENPGDVDICIGFNSDWSCPAEDTIQSVQQHFEEWGYRVGINYPFSNSKTVDIPIPYHSFMVEVSKRLYMNEDTLEHSEGFERLKSAIQSLYTKLLVE